VDHERTARASNSFVQIEKSSCLSVLEPERMAEIVLLKKGHLEDTRPSSSVSFLAILGDWFTDSVLKVTLVDVSSQGLFLIGSSKVIHQSVMIGLKEPRPQFA